MRPDSLFPLLLVLRFHAQPTTSPTRPVIREPPNTHSLVAFTSPQAVPLGFFITAMPVILRSEGLPIEHVGLFSAIAFPWLLKFLWAPVVDGHRWPFARGHYLSWILLLQALAIASVLGLAALDLASQLALVVGLAAPLHGAFGDSGHRDGRSLGACPGQRRAWTG